MDQDQAQTTTVPKSPSLPSVKILLEESWEVFSKSLLNIFILEIILIVGGLLILGVALLASLPFGAYTFIMNSMEKGFDPASIASLGVIIFIVIIAAIIWLIFATVVQIATIMIVAEYKSPPSFKLALKRGLKLVVPLSLSSIITSFIVLGGFFLFIIPGILLSFLLSFSSYEIILNNQKVMNSLRRSMKLVLANFGPIALRIVLIIIFSIILSIPGFIIQEMKMPTLNIIYSILSFIVNLLFGWFTVAYAVTLYRHASKGFENSEGSRLRWPIIISIIGWIMSVIFFIGMAGLVYYFMSQKPASTSTKTESNQVQIKELTSTKNAMEKTNIMLEEMLKLNDPKEIAKINDERIQIIKDALVLDEANPMLHYYLAASYTFVNNSPTADVDMLTEARTAVTLDTTNNKDYVNILGRAYLRNRQYEDAVLQLEKALRGDPTNPDIYYYLGVSYEGLQLGEEAVNSYTKAIELYTKINSDGKYDQTILQLRKGIATIKNNPK